MRLTIAAVGHMRAGPERDLFTGYGERAARMGKPLGFSGPRLREFDESRLDGASARMAQEAGALLGALGDGAVLVALDETGKTLTSVDFARRLEAWKDQSIRDCLFVIGGPDGHGQAVRERAGLVLSLGAMTWPHLLARVMLGEQIYRAMTILSGHPYHRQ